MKKILLFVALASIMSATAYFLIRRYRERFPDDRRISLIPVNIGICTVSVSAGYIMRWLNPAGLICCLLALVPPLSFMLSSFWGRVHAMRNFRLLSAMQVLPAVAVSVSCFQEAGSGFVLAVLFFISLQPVTIFTAGLVSKMRDVRMLMREGTVWQTLCFNVEAVYAMVVCVLVFMSLIGLLTEGTVSLVFTYLSLIMILILIWAMVWRICTESLFVVMRERETRILESLKISQVEMANGVKPDAYRDLYDRILEYFETERPFLNNNLTMNDIVKVVFSNKTYISRVISLYTGRNFCQFVNYYRVAYAMERFRDNPSLRVAEMAMKSGFNSVVSFNMAFRLFMNENPSDWCRRERQRIVRRK